MEQIATWSVDAIAARENPARLAAIKEEVVKLAREFPVPGLDARSAAD